jgi:dihydroorotate dehydrogenase (fumarate)
LFNRFYEPDIDLETMTFRPTLELSTRKDSRLALMWIALLAGKTPLSLAATGGVEGADEAVKYLLAGADAVLTASALLRHGPGHLGRLVKELAEWLEAHGAASVAEIRGRMSAARLAHPEVLLRAQHTPTLLLECPCRDIAPGAASP